jgi:hypothetical protein
MAAVDAAVRAAARYGYAAEDPLVIEETNNVVVWLRPHSIIAKVGRWSHSLEPLVREHSVASALAASGAPIASPLSETEPVPDDTTGFLITLWERLDGRPADDVDPAAVGRSLRTLHEHLARHEGDLPNFRSHIELARAALDNDRAMSALQEADRTTLRLAIDTLTRRVDAFVIRTQALHGEPHGGNMLTTATGIRWIDLEDVCLGPVEWDLAFLPDKAVEAFDDVDVELLGLVRTLNRACTAVWCWSRADLPGMLWHAKHHLRLVKGAMAK